jgi:hypothetical protein
LKAAQRQLRHKFPETVALRTHRALSWLQRAEKEADDDDARFVFLWIAFNAAYAREIANRADFPERRLWMSFLRDLTVSDTDNLLYNAVWQHFPDSIRLFLSNEYIFQPFWEYQNGRISELDWRERFGRSKHAAMRALGLMNTKKVLAILFDRLYVLRNQIVHGGATWNSAVNRKQVSEGARILGVVVPIVIHLIMNSPNSPWGNPCYPVVKL